MKTLNEVERALFMAGRTDVLALLEQQADELLDGTIPTDEAKELDERLEAATLRADCHEETIGHVVAALRSGRLLKAQAAALAGVLSAVVGDPEMPDRDVRIEQACGLREATW